MSDSSEEFFDDNEVELHDSSNEDLETISDEHSYHADASASPSENEAEAQFDTNLPTTHKYLGKLNNVSGYTLFDDGEQVTLLAIYINTLVFPGFTLPLVMNGSVERSIMQEFMKRRNIFALVCADEVGTKLCNYGVTMEVFESFTRHGVLYLKAKGRQRCKITPGKDIRRMGGRLQQMTFTILAEPEIKSPISDTQLLTLKSRRLCSTDSYDHFLKNYKYRRYHLAQFPFATWIYDHNEVCYYVKLMLDHLKRFYAEENIPSDPILLSYWFLQNFQLAHEERLHLMQLDSALERLRLEYKCLVMERLICCAGCKAKIAYQSDIFAMSKDGVQSNYCNPGGHVYETVTVLKANNYDLIGKPSKQFSWFPGYAWTIMQCRICHGHIGWKFSSRHLKPHIFYGLAKSGLHIQIMNESSNLSGEI